MEMIVKAWSLHWSWSESCQIPTLSIWRGGRNLWFHIRNGGNRISDWRKMNNGEVFEKKDDPIQPFWIVRTFVEDLQTVWKKDDWDGSCWSDDRLAAETIRSLSPCSHCERSPTVWARIDAREGQSESLEVTTPIISSNGSHRRSTNRTRCHEVDFGRDLTFPVLLIMFQGKSIPGIDNQWPARSFRYVLKSFFPWNIQSGWTSPFEAEADLAQSYQSGDTEMRSASVSSGSSSWQAVGTIWDEKQETKTERSGRIVDREASTIHEEEEWERWTFPIFCSTLISWLPFLNYRRPSPANPQVLWNQQPNCIIVATSPVLINSVIALHLQSCLPNVPNCLHSHTKSSWMRFGLGMWTAEHDGRSREYRKY
jgi:hypothetical protein